MAVDAYGNYYPDDPSYYVTEPTAPDQTTYDPNQGMFTGASYDPNQIDWANLDFSDPNLWGQYGLTSSDFYDTSTGTAPQYDETGAPAGAAIDPQSAAGQATQAVLDDAEAQGFITADQKNDPSIWASIGNYLSKVGTSALSTIMKNPLAGLATIAGGGAALGALFQPKPTVTAPNFAAPVQMSPQQRALFGGIDAQAGREEQLAQGLFPIQQQVQQQVASRLPGLAEAGGVEDAARLSTLRNIQAGVAAPPDPNAYPAEYEQWKQNMLAATGQIGQALQTPLGPSAEAQRRASEERQRFEQQQREAMGEGYSTSDPYLRGKAFEEMAIGESLDRDALQRQQQYLNMLMGVAQPSQQALEAGRTGQFGRQTAQRSQDLATLQGLDSTARTLGGLQQIAGAATPSGTAERAYGALTGQQGSQQQLINAMNQFNAQQQAAKNADLWKFAGLASGAGLYGLTKPTA